MLAFLSSPACTGAAAGVAPQGNHPGALGGSLALGMPVAAGVVRAALARAPRGLRARVCSRALPWLPRRPSVRAPALRARLIRTINPLAARSSR